MNLSWFQGCHWEQSRGNEVVSRDNASFLQTLKGSRAASQHLINTKGLPFSTPPFISTLGVKWRPWTCQNWVCGQSVSRYSHISEFYRSQKGIQIRPSPSFKCFFRLSKRKASRKLSWVQSCVFWTMIKSAIKFRDFFLGPVLQSDYFELECHKKKKKERNLIWWGGLRSIHSEVLRDRPSNGSCG